MQVRKQLPLLDHYLQESNWTEYRKENTVSVEERGSEEEFMRKQDKIFVIGHKNPDTDSICSAIAYCDIKKQNISEQKICSQTRRPDK